MSYRGYRLSEADVIKIIRLRDEEGLTFAVIAARFGVSHHAARLACRTLKARMVQGSGDAVRDVRDVFREKTGSAEQDGCYPGDD